MAIQELRLENHEMEQPLWPFHVEPIVTSDKERVLARWRTKNRKASVPPNVKAHLLRSFSRDLRRKRKVENKS